MNLEHADSFYSLDSPIFVLTAGLSGAGFAGLILRIGQVFKFGPGIDFRKPHMLS